MKLVYKDITKNDWFLVSWTLSNKCNYRCEYCPDILHNGSTGQPRWETVERFIKNLKVSKYPKIIGLNLLSILEM